MAISTGQVTPSTSVSSTLCTVPNGSCNVSITNTSGATVFITAGVAATQTNGFALPTGAPAVTLEGYPGSKGTTLYVEAATLGTVTGVVSFIISTGQ